MFVIIINLSKIICIYRNFWNCRTGNYYAYQLVFQLSDVEGKDKHPWLLVGQSLKLKLWQHPDRGKSEPWLLLWNHKAERILKYIIYMETIAFIIKYVLHKFLRIECCHVPSAELIEELEGKRPD